MDEFNVSEILKIEPVNDQRKPREWVRVKYNKKKKEERKEEVSKQRKSEGIIDIYV